MDKALRRIIETLKNRTGVDFSQYKTATIKRLLLKRIQATGDLTPSKYLDFLRRDKEEPERLRRLLLINTTGFFRDTEVFDYLSAKIIPALFKGDNDEIRVWVPGCSSGEEAYSIALLLQRHKDETKDRREFKLFATDLDNGLVKRARSNTFSERQVSSVSQDLLKRYFTRKNKHYSVIKKIRSKLVFARHNVLADPPYPSVDFLSCRNLLIYFDKEMKRRLFNVFHYALKDQGLLLLGNTEMPDSHDAFRPVDIRKKIYIKDTEAAKRKRTLDVMAMSRDMTLNTYENDAEALDEAIGSFLIKQFVPPTIVIDRDDNIVFFQGDVSRFLSFQSGRPNLNLFKAIKDELIAPLKAALKKNAEERKSISLNNVLHEEADRDVTVEIFVSPVQKPGLKGRLTAISFIPAKREETGQSGNVTLLKGQKLPSRGVLNTTIEEYEIENERLRLANEETLENNTKLQEAIEELESAREELKSLNDELLITNDELKIKNEELKISHDNVKNLLKATNVGTLFLDENLCIKLFNDAISEVVNIKEDDRGRSINDFKFRLKNVNLSDEITFVLQRGLNRTFEVDGTDKKTSWVCINPYYSDEQINGVILTFTDITEKKKRENELLEYQTRLEELVQKRTKEFEKAKDEALKANEAKTEFLAKITHDIKTPLNGVLGFADILKKSDLSPEQKHYIDLIRDSSKNQLRIINDILDYARIEKGTLDLNKQKINLKQLLTDALEIIKTSLCSTDVEIVFNFDDTIPDYIMTDSLRLNQIILNLLSNAAKFTSEGKIELVVEVVESWKRSLLLYFAVSDTGTGIHRDKKAIIMEAFKQESPMIARKYGGTGLGLSITSSLLKLMNSELQLDSAVGKGSTFSFLLEVGRCDDQKEEMEPESAETLATKNEKEYAIMVADDDPVSVELFTTVIKDHYPNTNITIARDGKEALGLYKQSDMDVVFIDIHMPEKDGFTVTKEILDCNARNDGGPCIIAVTADSTERTIERCHQIGISDYLAKPIFPDRIVSILNRHLK